MVIFYGGLLDSVRRGWFGGQFPFKKSFRRLRFCVIRVCFTSLRAQGLQQKSELNNFGRRVLDGKRSLGESVENQTHWRRNAVLGADSRAVYITRVRR
jgi:hypothetical protein